MNMITNVLINVQKNIIKFFRKMNYLIKKYVLLNHKIVFFKT